MRIRVCRSKNAGVAGYAEAFRPVHSDLQTSEWYSYFENDVLDDIRKGSEKQWEAYSPTADFPRKSAQCRADVYKRQLQSVFKKCFTQDVRAISCHQ